MLSPIHCRHYQLFCNGFMLCDLYTHVKMGKIQPSFSVSFISFIITVQSYDIFNICLCIACESPVRLLYLPSPLLIYSHHMYIDIEKRGIVQQKFSKSPLSFLHFGLVIDCNKIIHCHLIMYMNWVIILQPDHTYAKAC